jgi:CRP/FNR family transcriptional regulator, nitrogen fixation regulation protein
MSINVRVVDRSASNSFRSFDAARGALAERLEPARHRHAQPLFTRESDRFPFGTSDAQNNLRESSSAVTYPRGKLLYGENDPAEYVYVIESGLANTYKIWSDGRRQIVAFYCPGDLFGFQFGGHSLNAAAITRITVWPLKLATILKNTAPNSVLGRQLWNALAREQHRDQAHILRLGKQARQRVASFLLEMTDRLPHSGDEGLPISRQDIADHLGLTIETVSRSLTQIKGTTAITMSASRRIKIADPRILKQLSSQAD